MPARDAGGRARPLRALTSAPPPPAPLPRIAMAAGASAVLAVVAPAVLISLYAAALPGAERVTAFALRVAEPTALAAAVVVTASGARWAAAAASRPRFIGLVTGIAALLLGLGAAVWVGDVDGWTGAAAVLQPLAGLLGGHRAQRDAARQAARRDAVRGDVARSATGALPLGSATSGATPAARQATPRVPTPAVAFEATLVPPSVARARQAAAASAAEPTRD